MEYYITCFNRKLIISEWHIEINVAKSSQGQPVICITHFGKYQRANIYTLLANAVLVHSLEERYSNGYLSPVVVQCLVLKSQRK